MWRITITSHVKSFGQLNMEVGKRKVYERMEKRGGREREGELDINFGKKTKELIRLTHC